MKFAKSRAAKASIIVGLSVVLIAAIASAFGSFRSHDVPSIVREWQPSVVMVNCNFLEPGGHVKTVTESGVLLRDGQDGVAVLTNREVFDVDEQLASGCSVTDDGSLSISVPPASFATTSAFMAGLLRLPQTNAGELRGRALGHEWCGDSVAIGDRVVILGYASAVRAPMIATDGILAGYDGNDKYQTTAYLDDGLFGGAAIDATRDCYLGMAGRTMLGGTGGLGEIWKWQTFKDVLGRE
jgi:hypothetical protein